MRKVIVEGEKMSPLWYVLYLGLIGAGYAAAHVIGVKETRAKRVKTQDTRDKVQRVFDTGACPSYERLEAICRRFSDSLRAHEGMHQFTMAQLDRTVGSANRAYAQLGDAIADAGAGTAQLQSGLAEFCRKYSELVLLLGDVEQQSGHPIAPDDRFLAWVRDDEIFARELKRLAADPEYVGLARAVRGFFGNDGFVASQSLKNVVTAVLGETALLASLAPEPESRVHIRSRDRLSV